MENAMSQTASYAYLYAEIAHAPRRFRAIDVATQPIVVGQR